MQLSPRCAPEVFVIGHVIVTWTEHGNLQRVSNGGEPCAGWDEQNVKVESLQRSLVLRRCDRGENYTRITHDVEAML